MLEEQEKAKLAMDEFHEIYKAWCEKHFNGEEDDISCDIMISAVIIDSNMQKVLEDFGYCNVEEDCLETHFDSLREISKEYVNFKRIRIGLDRAKHR